MSYIYLSLALLSSFSIAVLLRHSEKRQGNRVVIIASNYIVAGSLGYLLAKDFTVQLPIVIFGSILGAFFFISFIVFSKAIKTEGIASAVTMGRLSLAIPVCFSIFLWGENPNLLDIAGLIAIFIIILAWEGKIGKVSPILLSLFLFFGGIDAAIKYFKLKFPSADDGFFLIMVFWSALIWSWLYVIFTRQPVKRADVISGVILGIPNYFSTYFILSALENIPGYIAFPFNNIGVIILSALTGHFFFKEKLDRKKVILIAVGIAAVMLLAT